MDPAPALTRATGLENGLAALRQPQGSWSSVGGVELNRSRSGAFVPGGTWRLPGFTRVNVPAGSNSGVYLKGRYEVQLRDRHGKAKPGAGDCGGICFRFDEVRTFEGSPPG